eukprot:GHVU01196931.1.p1 GENE.GHVU01196931.1~~GHVU01196931.1.p1  ORF type:complete len:175 (-),score=12.97 GHVU01196931.1:239-763(-)
MLLGCVTRVEFFCIVMTGSYLCISSLPLYLTSSVDRSFLVRRQWWRGGTASSIHSDLHLPGSNVLMYFAAKIFVQPHDLFLKVQVEETTELPQRSDGNSWYEFLKQQLVKSAKANKENNESIVKAIGNLDDGTYGAYMRTSDSKWVHLKKAEGEITKLPITFEFLVVPIEGERS